MANDPFLGAPTVLWTLFQDDHVAVCAVRYAPSMAELQIVCDGSLLTAQSFPSLDQALAWADVDRQTLVAQGWQVDGRAHGDA